MAAVDEVAQEKLLREYIFVGAFEVAMLNLANECLTDIVGAAGIGGVEMEGLLCERSEPRHTRLWTTDEETPEQLLADIASTLMASAILGRLTAPHAQEAMQQESIRLQGAALEQVRRMSKRLDAVEDGGNV